MESIWHLHVNTLLQSCQFEEIALKVGGKLALPNLIRESSKVESGWADRHLTVLS